MKNMKKMIMAFLVAVLMLPVLNAENEPVLTGLTVNGNTVDLTDCELTESDTVCSVEVPWNTKTVTIVATVDESTTKILEDSAELIKDPITLSAASSEAFNLIVQDKTTETNTTSYMVRIVKGETPEAKLTGLSVKLTADGENLIKDFAVDKSNYSVEVPYGTEKVIVSATAPNTTDYKIEGAKEYTIDRNSVSMISVTVTIGENTAVYYINLEEAENPMIALIEEVIANDESLKDKTGLYDLTDTTATFMYGNVLEESMIVKQYTVNFEEGADAATIVAALKEAMKKDADYSMLIPNDGKISDADLAGVKNEGGEVLVPTESEVIWVLDGSKITDTDKGFSIVVKTGEEVEKALYDKINKLLDPKDNGLIIDFEHDGVLPKGTKVMISAEDYAVGDLLSLYYYNEKTGKLELYKKNLKVQTYTLGGESANVVMLELDHLSSYVLLPVKNNAQTGVLNVVFYSILALGSLAGIVFLTKKKAN